MRLCGTEDIFAPRPLRRGAVTPVQEEKRDMRKIKLGALLGAFVMLTACAGGDEADEAATDSLPAEQPASTPAAVPSNVQLPEGVTPEMVAQGQEIFNTGICWSCHQQNGVGGPLAPALNDATWINTDGTFDGIVNVIKTGVQTPKQHPSAMPPMGGAQLSEDQVRAVAAYVYAISHGG